MENTPTTPDPTTYVRLALPLMSKHHVPMTPANYSVWYAYVTGENAALRKEIDALIAAEGVFSDEINDRLFHQFGSGTGIEDTRAIRSQLYQILVDLAQEVFELTSKTGRFETSLTKSSDLLSRNLTTDQLTVLINHLIAETNTVITYGKDSRRRIQSISGELETVKGAFESLDEAPVMDLLTGVANRKTFEDTLKQMTYHAGTLQQDLSLLLIDIDRFGALNENHGRVVGDEVLRFTANQIKKQLRESDFVARFSGEMFAVLLPGANVVGAKVAAENIRHYFSTTTLKIPAATRSLGKITVSIGAASYKALEPASEFVSRVEQALAGAKAAGRDRVSIE